MIKKYFPALQYLNVPNSITLTALMLGLCNICFIVMGWWKAFYISFLLVSCMDSLDGFAAKALNQCTPIGEELDSLCDGVNFVLVPALFAICVAGLHPMVIACAAPFCVGGILRLAYYNLRPEEEEGFVGVPTTIASMFAALFTWLFGLMFPRLWGLIGPALVLLGALMVCRKRFYGTNFLRVLFGVIGLGFVIAGLCL